MMMMETSDRGEKDSTDDQFTQTVFSWTLHDISNENLYKDKKLQVSLPNQTFIFFQVKTIPESFQSIQHYLGSFVYPLLEETRAQLYSSMEELYRLPFAEVVAFNETKPYRQNIYQVRVDNWKNRFSDRSKESYKTLPGDMLILVNAIPETFSDLERTGRSWSFLSVSYITENENRDNSSSSTTEDESRDDSTSITYFKVMSSKKFELDLHMETKLFVVFLGNLTTNKRVWRSLHMSNNLRMLDYVLSNRSWVRGNCDACSEENCSKSDEKLVKSLSPNMNESQIGAVLACLHMMHCENRDAFELIWGPPGTGKTKTNATLLVSLLKMNYRTLVCAPTNVAITEVASRVLKIVTESKPMFCSLGDILLFGNKERLKVGSDIEDIFLEHRVQRLTECLGSLGWNNCFTSMINFLENCVSQYHVSLENELIREQEQSSESKIKEEGSTEKFESFLDYVRKRFVSIVEQLRKCIWILCTHLPQSYIMDQNFLNMIALTGLLDRFETLLFEDTVVSEELEKTFSHGEVIDDHTDSFVNISSLSSVRNECLSILRNLHGSLKILKFPNFRCEEAITDFCFQRASLIFSTASSSYKLHRMNIKPLTVLVIDEAAQLKECESTIPLQIPGIKHAVLFGDEWQLPATVTSKISEEASFGRSLFQRLSSLNHSRHLLNTQYRMHPSICSFPNANFYHNQILDAPNVKRKSYEKHYLPGSMFGTYSFINVVGGREEKDDDGRSPWRETKIELSIGVVSPYSAQVVAIQEKLGKKYEKFDGFRVKVKTIDGFQGGEEDIIVLSTVRSDIGQSLDFISKPQRVKVVLTRARHSLWILGNERTLANCQSIWEALVIDAKKRHCVYNADEDVGLAKAMIEIKKELDQFDDLLNADSVLFRNAKWKVLFSDNFLKSFKKLTSIRKRKSILNLLLKLSSGWRPKRPHIESGSSLQIMRIKAEGMIVIITVDITKDIKYMQVLKIWDVLPPDDVPKLIKRLDSIFGKYTDDYVNLCNERLVNGNLELPKDWPPSLDFVRLKDLSNKESESELICSSSDGRSYVENSKVSESLLLMKFYSLSHGVVNHLLSDRDGREIDLPYEVTDEQMETILFNKSSFILGRSGTGKTTVLTMKLFQREQLHHFAMDVFYGMKTSQNSMEPDQLLEKRNEVLRQLFVTVSPKLCNAVKQHVSDLKRFACGGRNLDESSLTDIDDIGDEEEQFKNIPDSFYDIPANNYPLVITFHKFLMMLDGTLGNSYFERFLTVEELSSDQVRISRSVLLQNFLRNKEVNYEKFSALYWPHFNSDSTKRLDPSRVFIEIISHIKGGLQSIDASDSKLSREDYLKILKHERYKADKMNFVYIDEVQDLTMSQITLFKHMCGNVEEGFVFSGDTAQTIARGVDFRFQDIRHLFYKKFVLESKNENEKRKEKGLISDVFHLSQNFRTHAGILKLSQSIIELIYHFFPQSIDPLKPETSLIYGESPLLLQCGDDQGALRAGDTYWERLSKASGLKAMADRTRIANPDEANSIFREAAEIFEAIGKVDSAARCFSDLGEYERAGCIYLDKCGELRKAAECFSLAGCHELAANVYARGNFFSECLTACTKGRLFEMALDYIKCWKQNTANECSTAERSNEMKKIEQMFLERCALHYFEIKDKSSMMEFVKEFNSMDSIRNFLTSLCCLDELLLLEEEKENFMEAANIAKLIGDTLRRVDLLEQAGKFKDSANLILFYVLVNSLWSPGNKGWPLKQFKGKGDLLIKAKTFARNDTDSFYEIVCNEADIICNEQSDMVTIMSQMITSQRHKCVSGEVLSARKILDVHLSLKPTKYYWQEELVTDSMKHSEDMISKNQVSIESLVYFWNFWKGKIVGVFEYLKCLETQEVNEFRYYGEFCFNFLGVWREFNSLNPVFFLLNPEADWARDLAKRSNSGKLVSIDLHQLVSAAQRYWCSEMLSVGVMVLDRLKVLFNFPIQNCDNIFFKSRVLTLIYEVATFLLDAKILKLRHHESENLLKYIRFSTENIVDYIFPEWPKPSSENLILLRGTDTTKSMLNRVIAESDSLSKNPTYGRIGRIAMIILGSGKVNREHCGKIITKLNRDEKWKPWKVFFEVLGNVMGSDFPNNPVSPNKGEKSTQDCPANASEIGVWEKYFISIFKDALENTYNTNWRTVNDYISPSCFLYLIEYLLSWLCCFNGFFLSTRSTFVECLMYHERLTCLAGQTRSFEFNAEPILAFLCNVVQEFLNNKIDTLDWIGKSTTAVMEDYSLLVTRLVVLTCLVCVNFGSSTELLVNLLKKIYITEQLPHLFCVVLKRVRRRDNSQELNVNLIAEALKKIDNPMVIVNLWGCCPFKSCPDAMYVSMSSKPSKNEILGVLFPDKVDGSMSSVGVGSAVDASSEGDLPLSNASKDEAPSLSEACQASEVQNKGSKQSKRSKKSKSGRKKK
ncbi:hypothetical protein F8388_001533 [Cannabis sativa]|uniref:UvrD-like helicase ATP-binding domain-containing protein n=1 Tax=Cannabis sativa TaxID=3483 RepID=A0A7J6EP37_CANSA|nr:hypothetical protein F8388_001533 [Cannabis sativa]